MPIFFPVSVILAVDHFDFNLNLYAASQLDKYWFIAFYNCNALMNLTLNRKLSYIVAIVTVGDF